MPVVVEPPKKLAVHRGVWSTPPVLGTGNRWFESSCADKSKLVLQKDINKDADAAKHGIKTIRIKPKLNVLNQLEESLIAFIAG